LVFGTGGEVCLDCFGTDFWVGNGGGLVGYIFKVFLLWCYYGETFVASLTVKLPDDQKSEIEEVAERKNYNSVSEYVREALRDKVEEDPVLRPEVAEKLRKRLWKYREDESEGYTLEELDEELGLME